MRPLQGSLSVTVPCYREPASIGRCRLWRHGKRGSEEDCKGKGTRRQREVIGIGIEENGVLPIELLTPLTAEFYPDDAGDGFDEEEGGVEDLDGEDLAQYEETIQKMVEKENSYGAEDGKARSFCAEGGGNLIWLYHAET